MKRLPVYLRLFTYSILASSLFLFSCSQQPSQSSAQVKQEAESPSISEAKPDTDALVDTMTKSRGLDQASARMIDFSFESYFPQLNKLMTGDGNAIEKVSAYAEQVVSGKNLESEKDLLGLLNERNSLLKVVSPFVVNAELDPSGEQIADLERELNRLGMTMNMAEGMVFDVSETNFMQNTVARVASDGLQLYLDFKAAESNANNGEYPYLNMEPFQEMVLLGEKLKTVSPDEYYPKVEEAFHTALLTLTDIHQVVAQDGNESLLVGGIHQDAYPFATENESRARFAEKKEASAYRDVVAKILENTSSFEERPENLYLIVLEWEKEEDAAKKRIYQHLANGEDVPHRLLVERGNGTEQYAIVYRFYSDSEKAEAALSKVEAKWPSAEMIYVSVKGDKMYQLGV
ncbi:MAG: hypothetical protein AAF206_03365 [Bacteroidota bacterium]